jgi:class 3 adenylate cyclase
MASEIRYVRNGGVAIAYQVVGDEAHRPRLRTGFDLQSRLRLGTRAGVHTGECELHDGKVAGIAASIGARLAAEAQPGQVLVTGTVKDLVAGSGLAFEPGGERELKGVPGSWEIYAAANE